MSDCNNCQSKGLGDTVSNVIKKVSGGRIKECGGCSKRREWLNNKVSYTKGNALDAINKIQKEEII
jgi:hypothetical protein|tara:strand:+ start:406 stop:603 length:198 start_codon:yes stop_codon:yes gene_type:complete